MTDNEKELCGAQTGKGTPCQRPVGWGVPEDHDNPGQHCKFHLEERNQELKKRFVELLEEGSKTMQGCAQEIGKDQSTVWKWRQKDPEFDAKVRSAKSVRDAKMVADVEDKMYQMIMNGEASATDRIFFLKNRSPERWSDRKTIKHEDGDELVKRARQALKQDKKEVE